MIDNKRKKEGAIRASKVRVGGQTFPHVEKRLTIKEYVALVKAGDVEDQERTRAAQSEIEGFRL